MAKANGKTEVVVPNGGFDVAKFKTGAANVRATVKARAEFLKMDKDNNGQWEYGMDATPLGPKDELYVDPNGSVYGWQCWADTDLGVAPGVLGSVVVPIHQPMPPKPEKVPENGREWAQMYGLSMVYKGQALVYTNTSMGGRDAVAAFNAAFSEQLDTDESRLIAVITLASDWYKNKKHGGKTYVPIFKIVRWVSELPKEAIAKATAKAVIAKAAGKQAPPARKTGR